MAYRLTTIDMVILSTLGHPKKCCGCFMLFATGITCNHNSDSRNVRRCEKQEGHARRILMWNLQRQYLQWRISQSQRNEVVAPPRRTTWCYRDCVDVHYWKCNRAWSWSRSSWTYSPASRTAPYTSNRAPDRAAPMPGPAWVRIILFLFLSRFGDPWSEKKTRRTTVTRKIDSIMRLCKSSGWYRNIHSFTKGMSEKGHLLARKKRTGRTISPRCDVWSKLFNVFPLLYLTMKHLILYIYVISFIFLCFKWGSSKLSLFRFYHPDFSNCTIVL